MRFYHGDDLISQRQALTEVTEPCSFTFDSVGNGAAFRDEYSFAWLDAQIGCFPRTP